jgi:hypothetical protein
VSYKVKSTAQNTCQRAPSDTLYVRYGGTSNECKQPYFPHNEQFSKLEELLSLGGFRGGGGCRAQLQPILISFSHFNLFYTPAVRGSYIRGCIVGC